MDKPGVLFLSVEEEQKIALLEQACKAEEERCQQLEVLFEEEKRNNEETLNLLKVCVCVCVSA